MKKIFLIYISGIFLTQLTGCAGFFEQWSKNIEESRKKDQEAQANYLANLEAGFRSKCRGMGFRDNTDGMRLCIMQLSDKHTRDEIEYQRAEQKKWDDHNKRMRDLSNMGQGTPTNKTCYPKQGGAPYEMICY